LTAAIQAARDALKLWSDEEEASALQGADYIKYVQAREKAHARLRKEQADAKAAQKNAEEAASIQKLTSAQEQELAANRLAHGEPPGRILRPRRHEKAR